MIYVKCPHRPMFGCQLVDSWKMVGPEGPDFRNGLVYSWVPNMTER